MRNYKLSYTEVAILKTIEQQGSSTLADLHACLDKERRVEQTKIDSCHRRLWFADWLEVVPAPGDTYAAQPFNFALTHGAQEKLKLLEAA